MDQEHPPQSKSRTTARRRPPTPRTLAGLVEYRQQRRADRKRPLPNEAEQMFEAECANLGWFFTKMGWPDFFIYKDGGIACVEVKPGLTRRRTREGPADPRQMLILRALAAHGIPCFVWTPTDGFIPVRGDEE